MCGLQNASGPNWSCALVRLEDGGPIQLPQMLKSMDIGPADNAAPLYFSTTPSSVVIVEGDLGLYQSERLPSTEQSRWNSIQS